MHLPSTSLLAEPWRGRPLPALIDPLIAAYHRPFDARLAEVDAAFAHAAHPAWEAARGGLAEIGADLRPHMAKEEQVLFPWLRTRSDTAAGPIRVMQLEHADFLQLLHALHGATLAASSLAPAPAAVLAHAALDRWLREHIVLEDTVLFPRALGLVEAAHVG